MYFFVFFPFVQSATVYYEVISEVRFTTNKMVNYGKKYIHNDNSDENDYNEICSRNMDATLKRFIIIVSIVCLSFVIALIGPLYAYTIHGTRKTLLSVRLPFVEKDSDLEYMLNIILQTWSGIAGFCGNVGIECGYNIIISSIKVTTQLIEMDIKSLSNNLEAETLTKTQIKNKLSMIFQKIDHTDGYISSILLIFCRYV